MSEFGPGALNKHGDPDALDSPDAVIGVHTGATGREEEYVAMPAADPSTPPSGDTPRPDSPDTVVVPAPLDTEPDAGSPERRTIPRSVARGLGAVAVGVGRFGRDFSHRLAETTAGSVTGAVEGVQNRARGVQRRAHKRAHDRYQRDVNSQVGDVVDRRVETAKQAKLRRDAPSAAHEVRSIIDDDLPEVKPTKGRLINLASKVGLAPTEEERQSAVLAKYKSEVDAAPGAPDAQMVAPAIKEALDSLEQGEDAKYIAAMRDLQLRVAYNKSVAHTMDDAQEQKLYEQLAQRVAYIKNRKAAEAATKAAEEAAAEAKKAAAAERRANRKTQVAGWEDPANVLELKKAIAKEIEAHESSDPDRRNDPKYWEMVADITQGYMSDYFGRSAEERDADRTNNVTNRHMKGVPAKTQDEVMRLLNMSVSDLEQVVAQGTKESTGTITPSGEPDNQAQPPKNLNKPSYDDRGNALVYNPYTGKWMAQPEGLAREAAKAAARAAENPQRPTAPSGPTAMLAPPSAPQAPAQPDMPGNPDPVEARYDSPRQIYIDPEKEALWAPGYYRNVIVPENIAYLQARDGGRRRRNGFGMDSADGNGNGNSAPNPDQPPISPAERAARRQRQQQQRQLQEQQAARETLRRIRARRLRQQSPDTTDTVQAA
jgi:hypothetical protein